MYLSPLSNPTIWISSGGRIRQRGSVWRVLREHCSSVHRCNIHWSSYKTRLGFTLSWDHPCHGGEFGGAGELLTTSERRTLSVALTKVSKVHPSVWIAPTKRRERSRPPYASHGHQVTIPITSHLSFNLHCHVIRQG